MNNEKKTHHVIANGDKKNQTAGNDKKSGLLHSVRNDDAYRSHHMFASRKNKYVKKEFIKERLRIREVKI
jgi:hypothetical protein